MMIIRSLHLENYRCFKDFDIEFDDRLTVLVGVNGAGKTSVLDALSGYLVNAWRPKDMNCFPYSLSFRDVSKGSKAEDVRYCIEVSVKRHDGYKLERWDSFCHEARENYNSLLLISEEESYDEIPYDEDILCVAYLAERFIRVEDTILQNSINTLSSSSAYTNNFFSRTIDYASTLIWFNNADADEARAMRDGKKTGEYLELSAVREALTKALLGKYERPRMLGNPPELIVYKKGTDITYKVSQLSDGYRAMLALVMDLARRMAQSRDDRNDSNKSILETTAIVLIDEVELHLHPAWQQTVLTTLMDIFPNTQFIVTTHSPQVLTSIPPKHIRILKDGKAYPYNEQTKGAEASRLLKGVFGVEPRPNGLDIVKSLIKYRDLVYAEKWDTSEAEKLREELDEHFGDDDPMMAELDLHIENVKWERGL